MEDIVGIAKYVGSDPDTIQEFGHVWHVLYNTEGFYVKSIFGGQKLINSAWQLRVFPPKSEFVNP